MLTMRHFTSILWILLTLQYHSRSGAKHEISELQHQCNETYSRTGTWPFFANKNGSYVYFLGIFLQQRSRMAATKHAQTAAEPSLFRAAILLAQKRNMTINGKQIAYRVEETTGRDIIEALDRTCVAIAEDHILGIVGPEYSSEAKTLARFCNRVGLPIMGYSTNELELSDRHAYPTFYRLASSDVHTARALLKLFQIYNWNSTNIIYQGDSFGQSGLQALTEVFNDEVKISRAIRFDLYTNSSDNLRRQLENSLSRIVIVIANPNVTTSIVHLALKAGNIMAPSFLWILTASNPAIDLTEEQYVNQLPGMLMLKTVSPLTFNISTNTSLLDEALCIWKQYDPDSFEMEASEMDIYSHYAFDSAWLLILAYQELCQKNPTTCLALENTDHCFHSNLTSSEQLHKTLQKMSFTGLSGRVQFGPDTTDRVDNTGTHYTIYSVQPLRVNDNVLNIVEVLRLNASALNTTRNSETEWTSTGHPIRWPKKWDVVPTDYPLLEGKTLNITVYISPPFFMQRFSPDNHEQPLYEGYIHELLTLLAEKMNFKFHYKVASNETRYDELVECVRNRTCEIAAADLAMTTTRAAKIDFSVSIYANALRLVVLKDKRKTISPFAFLKPFSWLLWLMIIAVILFPSAALIAVYEQHDPDSEIYDESWKKKTGKSLYLNIGALLQRGCELQVKTLAGRIQIVNVWFMSIVLVSLFTSNLIVYFTAQYSQPWLHNVEELKMCRKVDCNRIGIVEHSQHEEYFIKEVMDNKQWNYHHLKHPKECFTKLLEKHIDVAFTDSPTAQYFMQNQFCQLQFAGAPFGKTDFGLALPKQWPYKQDLDAHILQLRTRGEMDRLLDGYLQQKNCDINGGDGSEDQKNGLTPYEVSGLFIVFAGITFLNSLHPFLRWICSCLFNEEQHTENVRF